MEKLRFAKPEGLIENIEAFFTAVNIYESFNIALLSFHIATFALIILTRKRSNIQILIFLFLLLSCFFLENLNNYLNANWPKYTSQNYFDKTGLFVCIMIGFPALCNCVIIMIFSMMSTFNNLTNLARLKLQKKNN